LRESIIGREVYTDLRRELNKRRDAIADRPALNLGLELQAMIARVPLFAGLDKEGLMALSRRLRAVVALPNEKIIATGSRPDAMYFIAAGDVTVVRDGSRMVLREGDFFGEMGLLERTLRNATVTAKSPVRLITLTGWDLKRVERSAPEAMERIRAVLEERRQSG
jgi:CPA1 family monovalent cation:H+ antiporter